MATLHSELKLPVPQGFVITANSFNYFMEYNDLRRPVDEILSVINSSEPHSLMVASAQLMELIEQAEIPSEISEEVGVAWKNFASQFSGRILRIDYVEAILQESGFQVTPKDDLLDARLEHMDAKKMLQQLQIVGRLLGVTKLMDMRLKDDIMVKEQVEAF